MLNITAFLSYVFISSFTPGPNNIMSMSNASKYGFRRSIKFNVGVFVGFLIVIALCILFSAGLFNYIPSIRPAMTAVGAVYILWLAWKIIKSKPNHAEDTPSQNSFLMGLLLQFVNPKVILYSITTVSTFIIPYYNSPAILTVFAVFLAAVGFTATCCWALFGAVFQKFLSQNAKLVNTIMSSLLLYCAVSLFF